MAECHGELNDPEWIRKIPRNIHISKKQIAATITQPNIETWLRKLRLSHYIRQHRPTCNIHPPGHSYMTQIGHADKECVGRLRQLLQNKEHTDQQTHNKAKNNYSNT